MTIRHSQISLGQLHVPYNFEYTDESARLAATDFLVTDIGKLARQLNNNSLWMLINNSPAAWVAVGKNNLAATDVTYDGSVAPLGGSASTQEAIESLAANKADLIDGKLDPDQLPTLSPNEEIAASLVIYDNATVDLGTPTAQDAIEYLAQNKASLVGGVVPVEQLPAPVPIIAAGVSYDSSVVDFGGADNSQAAFEFIGQQLASISYSLDALPVVDPLKPIWAGAAPTTIQTAIDRLAYTFYKHMGDVSIIELP